MRLAGRFSRAHSRVCKAKGIPVVDGRAGERKHELAEEYLAQTKITHGLFSHSGGLRPGHRYGT
jgi:hypothetical protein